MDEPQEKKKKRRIVPFRITEEEARPNFNVPDGSPQDMFMQDKIQKKQDERNKILIEKIMEKLDATSEDTSDDGMNAADMMADEKRRKDTSYRDRVQRMAKLLQEGFPALGAKEIMERVLTKIKGPPAAIQQQQAGLDELRNERNKLIDERNGIAQKIRIFKEADGAMDNMFEAVFVQGDLKKLIASLEKTLGTLQIRITSYKRDIEWKEMRVQDVKFEMDEKNKLSNAIDKLAGNKQLLLDVINKIQDNKTRPVGDHILGEIIVGIQGYTI